jgi:tripartite ATP-independent transporter DctM subunit
MTPDLMGALAVLGFLVAFLASGLWVFVAVLLVAFCSLYFVNDFSIARIGFIIQPVLQRTLTSYDLAALPMFVWMAEILFRSKLSDEIFAGLAPWLSRVPGRLLHVNVLGCGLFGSVSGSSAATCATIAKIALPELARRGYDERVSLGSLAGAGTLGILIPPSITMVIYALAADVSLIRLFLAGFLPGLLVMVLYSGYIAVWAIAHKDRMPPAEPPSTWREKLKASRNLLPTLALIAALFAVMLLGWVSPSECAAFGVLGSLLIAARSRSLTWDSVSQSIVGTLTLTCMILLILAAAAVLSAALAYTGLPMKLAAFVGGMGLGQTSLIAILLVFYILLGTAVDGVSLIVLTMPVVLPIVAAAQIDLVWFGIFMILVIEMAEVSPPIGFNLFVLQTMSGRDSSYVARAALPFFLLLVAAVAMITLVPNLVTVVPDLAYGRENAPVRQ